METNLDVLVFSFAVFTLAGAYLHSGHELDWIVSAHNGIMNTSYHHCMHHALSFNNKPLYCGVAVRLWDQLSGSEMPEDKNCVCVICERYKGNRSLEKWDALEKPDYSVLLKLDFWWNYFAMSGP